ncbi:MAG: YidC/Oxa1 family insertase periplasmic-domain containing protein [Pirellulaceae bacterium]|nr:YidC/Oxa1 family insertase periplasmic-domain containing protein [Pirellulaceae bacterium]
MEKRFVLFLLSTFLVLSVYVGVKLMFTPQVAVEAPRDGEGEETGQAPPAPAQGEAEQGAVSEQVPAGEVGTEPPQPSPEAPATPSIGAAAGTDPPALLGEPVRVMLGSMAAQDGYFALVTLNARGAALERFELTGRDSAGRLRYRNLEHRHGYLGHLALEAEPSAAGCRVRAVGPGTPAALASQLDGRQPAGVQVGDVIEGINDVPVATPGDVERLLNATRPQDVFRLAIVRGSGANAQRLQLAATLTEQPLEMIQPEFERAAPQQQHPESLLMSVAGVGSRLWRDAAEEPPILALLRTANWTGGYRLAEESPAEQSTAAPSDTEPAASGEEPPATADETTPAAPRRVWTALPPSVVSDAGGQMVEFHLLLTHDQLAGTGLTGDWEFIKRYRLPPVPVEAREDPDFPAYHLEVELEIHNRSSEPQQLAYRLGGPNGLPLEGWWYSNKIHPQMFKSAGARDVVWRPHGYLNQQLKGTPQIQRQAVSSPESPATPLLSVQDPSPLDYIGVDAQYFSSVLLPDRPLELGLPPADPAVLRFQNAVAVALGDPASKSKGEVRTTNTSVELTGQVETIAPGEPLKQRFLLFAGPKRPGLLAFYGLGDLIEYGWFEMVAVPLSAILHFFYYLVGNFGLAIVMLTILVRGCMFPISRKATRNAQKMQELAPELKKIADKYKNDMDKRGQAQKELFARHKYNPAGGCLLMFLQLPVFIGLYRCLSVDIELRQAPLIPGLDWASNLAGPDQLLRWDGTLPEMLAGYTGWLGPYLNILPIITIGLFMAQQKLFTPPPTDEQSRMQAQVMKFMMVFMGVLFFKVPAGLCLYFIVSSMWGLGERLLLPKATPAAAGAAGGDKPLLSLATRSEPNGAERRAQAQARKRQRQRKR